MVELQDKTKRGPKKKMKRATNTNLAQLKHTDYTHKTHKNNKQRYETRTKHISHASPDILYAWVHSFCSFPLCGSVCSVCVDFPLGSRYTPSTVMSADEEMNLKGHQNIEVTSMVIIYTRHWFLQYMLEAGGCVSELIVYAFLLPIFALLLSLFYSKFPPLLLSR